MNHLIDHDLARLLLDIVSRLKTLEKNQLSKDDIQKEIEAFDRLHNKE